jgi:hypothetical protein
MNIMIMSSWPEIKLEKTFCCMRQEITLRGRGGRIVSCSEVSFLYRHVPKKG